jgi:hypothetical protein
MRRANMRHGSDSAETWALVLALRKLNAASAELNGRQHDANIPAVHRGDAPVGEDAGAGLPPSAERDVTDAGNPVD